VAVELTEHDALGAHAEVELGIDPDVLTSPWQAAGASMVAFIVGALLPVLTITLLPGDLRIWGTVAAVVVALALTGFLSARLAEAEVRRAILRNICGGLLAMGVTYLIGDVVGGRIV
jgi:VIT1/CCC1 family predicted Fe2+/Mn2+ transporter